MFSSLFKKSKSRRSLEMTKKIFEQFPSGALICQADSSRKILMANHEISRMAGCDSMAEFYDFVGNCFDNLIVREDLDHALSIIEELKNDDTLDIYSVNFRIKCKNGSVKRLKDYVHYVHDSEHGPIFYMIIVDDTDINDLNENRENTDILSVAGIGMWHIILENDKKPRFKANSTMRELLGINGQNLSEEEVYDAWYTRIVPSAIPSVQKSVEEMLSGKKSENTYLWNHPTLGDQYVRCGGTAYSMQDGKGWVIRGYHYNVTEDILRQQREQAKINELNDEKKELFGILESMSNVYQSMHCIDLANNTARCFHCKDKNPKWSKDADDAARMMREWASEYPSQEFKEKVNDDSDLETLPKRLKNKSNFYFDFLNSQQLWVRGSFAVIKTDEKASPVCVIFTTLVIDEEKRREADLLMQSNTDGLTHLFNRRSFEKDIAYLGSRAIQQSLVIVSFDVNGLKKINDSLGHQAGDELISGAAKCISNVFGSYGKVYRIGGDEFAAIITADANRLKMLTDDFELETANWHGVSVPEIVISFGTATHAEQPFLPLNGLVELADKRMYENKENFYRKRGTNIRIQQSVFKAVCDSYIKILKINLNDDSYSIIKMIDAEKTADNGFSPKISEWLHNFAQTGQIHQEDQQSFADTTSMEHLRKVFSGTAPKLSISYRRMVDGVFKQALMEFVPSEGFSKENMELYLFVKSIDN